MNPIPSNNVRVEPFSPDNFRRIVANASQGVPDTDACDQVNYLARYLGRLGARTILVEEHYVDRHFREEYALYYSRCLIPPTNYCRRLHFIVEELDEAGLSGRIVDALSNRAAVEKALTDKYLGYVVLRPIPEVPVGRTVLPALCDDPTRQIFATSKVDVHLMGLKLQVTGTAFQQQDRAVGACATAAIWMAMSRAARLDGSRAPTPAFIAEAATKIGGVSGRYLPSRGLTLGQVTDAIRHCGFEAETVTPFPRPMDFVFTLHCYLRSGIPVVLVIGDDGAPVAHAVTVVGYRVGEPRDELETIFRPKSRRISQLYVHDDRLGPYARAEIAVVDVPPSADGTTQGYATLEVTIWDDSKPPEKQEKALRVVRAIVPVYPRLRLPPESLIEAAVQYEEGIQNAIGYDAECETFFVRAGSYFEDIEQQVTAGAQLPGDRVARFFRDLALPRWACVVRWWDPRQNTPVADFLFDTTDVIRKMPNEALLGAVAFDARLRPWIDAVAAERGAPTL